MALRTVRSFGSHYKFLDVSIEKENGVATITIKHPPVNSINVEFLSELSDTLTNLEKMNCRGMVLTSFSDKMFGGGLDINELWKTNRERFTHLFYTLQKTSIQLYSTSFPTVAVITGHSPGAGCIFGLCCEYRIMVDNFTIGLPEVQLGYSVPVWASNMMLNTIGPRNTELALNEGKLFKTIEALKVGLIDEIATNRTDALQKANKFLKRFEMIPSIGRIDSKNSVRGALIEILSRYIIIQLCQDILSMALRTVRSFGSHYKFLDVSIDKENGVATITIKHPPVNSINVELLSELSDTLTNLEKMNCRGMVLTSFSDKMFGAGVDINELWKTNRVRFTHLVFAIQKACIQLYSTSFPTVAVITGNSPGTSCIFVLCCEYRIMVDNFTIGLPEVQLGLSVPVWVSNIMINTIGPRNTELALNEGKLFKTIEALKVGLIDEIATNRTDALQKANKFLKRFEMIPPIGRIDSKNSVRGALIEDCKKNGQKYTEDFVSFSFLPEVQQRMELYVNKLKNKNKQLYRSSL